MIIDSHYHFIPLPPGLELDPTMVRNWVITGQCAGIMRDLDDVLPEYNAHLDDPGCEKLIQRMDESGIDITALLLVDNINHGFNTDIVTWAHEECSKAVARHPKRLFALASVDPRRPEAPDLLRQYITDFNMKGLKIHPGAAFYPNSPEAYAVLEVANELNIPVLIHCGPLPEYPVKYSHPIHLDDVAHDFPDLTIIAAHSGESWWREWLAIAKYKKNIFGDLAIWQLTVEANPHLFRRALREILDTVGPERILFGSDGPILEPFVSSQKAVQRMKALVVEENDGISFSNEEITAILGGNAERIFNLAD